MVSSFPWWWENRAACAFSASLRARSASSRSRAIRSPSSPVFDNQVERVRREAELTLRNGQAASVSFHGGCSFALVRRVKGWILLARVNPSAGAKLAARVLPNLPLTVPMEAKLRQLRRHVARLLLPKLNPNPLADNLTQFPKKPGVSW